VSIPETNSNNINDLINGYYRPYLIDGALRTALSEEINKQEIDSIFKQKLIQLNRTVTKFQLHQVLNLFKDAQNLRELSKKLVILKAEIAMPYLKGYLSSFFNVKVGHEKYFQRLITPICFRSDFPHVSIADNM
jgi:hypothetical protein